MPAQQTLQYASCSRVAEHKTEERREPPKDWAGAPGLRKTEIRAVSTRFSWRHRSGIAGFWPSPHTTHRASEGAFANVHAGHSHISLALVGAVAGAAGDRA